MWLRQMAQLSTTMSHAHRATAFHYPPVSYVTPHLQYRLLHTFLTSKRFLSPSVLAPALATFAFEAGASVMFTSAMFTWSLRGEECGEALGRIEDGRFLLAGWRGCICVEQKTTAA